MENATFKCNGSMIFVCCSRDPKDIPKHISYVKELINVDYSFLG